MTTVEINGADVPLAFGDDAVSEIYQNGAWLAYIDLDTIEVQGKFDNHNPSKLLWIKLVLFSQAHVHVQV